MTLGTAYLDMPARLTVIAVRHGSTDLTGAVFNGSGDGAADPDLNDEGRGQVARLRQRLADLGLLDAVSTMLASTSRRAITTAEVLAGGPVATDPRLCEVDFGRWEGRSAREISRDEPHWYSRWLRDPDVAPPGGTSLGQVAQRGRDWRHRVISELPPGGHAQVLVVAHASTVRVLVADALFLPLVHASRITVAPAAVATVSFWTDGGSCLESLTSH